MKINKYKKYGCDTIRFFIHSLSLFLKTISLRINKRMECDFKSIRLYQKMYVYPEGGSYNIGKKVQIGYDIGGRYKKGYCELQARNEDARICIGDYTSINNNFLAIACKEILIGSHCRIGINCQVLDSDFHDIEKNQRSSAGQSDAIVLGDNVWIGNNVIILKGVRIGENSIVGAGSVVTKSIPDNEIWGGSPARFIRKL